MTLGTDFFKWFKFVFSCIKLLIEIFGKEEDKEELKKNGF